MNPGTPGAKTKFRMYFVLSFVVAIVGYISYQFFIDNLLANMRVDSVGTCVKSTSVVPGPEDFAFSKNHDVVFISSHRRRNFGELGMLFIMHPTEVGEEISPMLCDYPPLFRPHGMAIFEDASVTRLYVISHRNHENMTHTIEIFDYTYGNGADILTFVKTLHHPTHLSSPNDLFSIGFDSLLVSNDHRNGSPFQHLIDDALQARLAPVSHYDALSDTWSEVADSGAAFGNGIIVTTEGDREVVYRSSSADFTLMKYELVRTVTSSPAAAERVHFVPVSETPLPLSPDNIELDPETGGLIITGHPSTYRFLANAILRVPAPSGVLLFFGLNQSLQSIYLDPVGMELSAASVAVYGRRRVGAHSQRKLFIGQVFEPYILICNV